MQGRRVWHVRCAGVDLAEQLPLEVTLKGPAGTEPVAVAANNEDGCYECTYTAPAAGFYRLELLCRGKPVAGSPLSVQA